MMISVVFMEVLHLNLIPKQTVNVFSFSFLFCEYMIDVANFLFVLSDCFPSVGNANAQVLQYESASRYVDTGCKYEEFYESYLKIDGHSGDKTQEKNLKSCFSFNDKSLQPSSSPQRKQSTVIMLSYKRKSMDGNEKPDFCLGK